jgi:hypothetical protein
MKSLLPDAYTRSKTADLPKGIALMTEAPSMVCNFSFGERFKKSKESEKSNSAGVEI